MSSRQTLQVRKSVMFDPVKCYLSCDLSIALSQPINSSTDELPGHISVISTRALLTYHIPAWSVFSQVPDSCKSIFPSFSAVIPSRRSIINTAMRHGK